MKGRLSVVETVYHQLTDQQPVCVDHRFSRALDSDEEPYQRKCKAGDKWQPLDLGWVPMAGQLWLRNEEGKFARVPSPEEKEEVQKKVILLAFDRADEPTKMDMHDPPRVIVPDIAVPPGESCRFLPAPGRKLLVKVMSGQAAFTVFVTPY